MGGEGCREGVAELRYCPLLVCEETHINRAEWARALVWTGFVASVQVNFRAGCAAWSVECGRAAEIEYVGSHGAYGMVEGSEQRSSFGGSEA